MLVDKASIFQYLVLLNILNRRTIELLISKIILNKVFEIKILINIFLLDFKIIHLCKI